MSHKKNDEYTGKLKDLLIKHKREALKEKKGHREQRERVTMKQCKNVI